jgi:sialate O-acetylesterase
MPSPHSSVFLLLAALLALDARADVRPSALFQDHAILQRDKPVPVWGLADPGERVRVTFAGQSVSTIADASGRWRVDLGPLPANSTPATLTIAGNNTLTFSDILVGEVWLASGQSNMELPLDKTYDADLQRLTARLPAVREIMVPHVSASSPRPDFAGEWRPAAPETVGRFSAVAYAFAGDLHLALGVPVGIINCTWGSTTVEAWMSPASLKSDPAFAVVAQRWEKQLADHRNARAAHQKKLEAWKAAKAAASTTSAPFTTPAPVAPRGPAWEPSSLFHGMVAPLLPCALRGTIWYQGESNDNRPAEYHALFAALIQGWRTAFAQGDTPFYWTQLAAFRGRAGNAPNPDGTDWAILREAQSRTLALPATGQAVAMDLGDYTDIHPRAKQEVGRRLARLALHRTYGFTELADSGPTYSGIESRSGALLVSFQPAERRLGFTDTVLGGFEVAGDDRVFHPATAKLQENRVLVASPAVPAPVAVRYAWRNYSPAPLHDDLGLPVPPFRSDTW